MTIDRPAGRLEHRGTVLPTGIEWRQKREHLTALARQFPVGTRVTHTCGRQGFVALDQPSHVPGLHDGKPTAVCLAGEFHSEPMVFVHWDNDAELTWGVWVPATAVRRSAVLSANRPSNKARIGGRR